MGRLVLISSEEIDGHYLMHYRTKGSKNGVRRYQNKDGSLTSEGYQHYSEMYGWGKGRSGNGLTREQKQFAKEYDAGVRTGKYDNDPELKELFVMEHTERYQKAKDKADSLMNEKNSLIEKQSELGDEWQKIYDKKDAGWKVKADEVWDEYEKVDNKIEDINKQVISAINELGTASGYGKTTTSDYVFENAMHKSITDPEVMNEVKDRIKDVDKSTIDAFRKIGSDYMDAVNASNDNYYKYSKKWSEDNPGKEWDGDGTELWEELMDRYPLYKKSEDAFRKMKNKFIKECIKLSKNKAFDSMHSFDKYENFFDYATWTKVGTPKPFAIAVSMFPKWPNIDPGIFAQQFVEYFDGKGKSIENVFLMD